MLVVNEPTKDLGRIRFGKPHNFTYHIKNTGTTWAEITKLVVGCTSCTKAHTTKTKLSPGEETIIDVIFTPGSIGPQKKFILVRWDNANEIKLSFTAESHE